METSYLISRGGLRINCRMTLPDFESPRQLVLGVHGLTGSSRDGIQQALAEEMDLFGAAVFRFDFPGHGESPMDNSHLNLHDCVETLLAVARDARERFPGVEELCIFATGFGAYITLIALEALTAMPGQVKLVVHTPSVRMDDTLLRMFRVSQATLRAMDRLHFPVERPFDITCRFYEEMRVNSVLIHPQPIPMLILHCDEDAYIQMSDIQLFRQLNEQAKLVILPGISHRFQEEGAWDMVLDLTRDWFEYEQVLLCDWS